ncbi:Alg9 family protein mannosyltransferase [Fulvivirga imtechensis AK7]|uniref:Alg9 family protein mannosyltransferase n=1 Tax=Fulvivirga imtechensis AK7 TaxID=1237149 RepID=L8JYN6_9BACT|nr:glycosyltransferase family 39 protein [Fulvivirga imtechensis]ELR73268.1 Alg9 family protein mannosyltransferase [Fulvivirga imtechensis AK7]
MKSNFYTYYQQHPLRVILFAALLLRILAAFFSKGYAFHDDHFCVIRVAQSWSDAIPHWLEESHPPKHSMVYAGINALFMWIMSKFSIDDPMVKTTFLRLIHALYSLLTIYFSYKIVSLLSSRKNAILAGWLLCVLWFMPYLSVQFLAELVCVPPVLAAFYLILKGENKGTITWNTWIWAGILFGIAFSIRLHTVLFAGGMGMVLLYEKKWVSGLWFTVGFLIITFVLIGIPDIIFFDYPYQYVIDYFVYNSENAYNYITGSPFKFLLTTFGFLVPPVSIFLMWGYIRTWKVEPKLFVAVFIFFLVHSIFPNKQERFLLPMYPMLIILGVIGWNSIKEQSKFWAGHPALYGGLWKFFWTINVIAALGLALTYSKKDRVEPLYYLSKKEDVKAIILESERGQVKQPPVYYLGGSGADYDELQLDVLGLREFKAEKKYTDPGYIITFNLGADKTVQELRGELQRMQKEPNYIIFKGDENLEARKDRVLSLFPGKMLVLQTEISPSRFDRLLHFLNPKVHRNHTARVYKIQ